MILVLRSAINCAVLAVAPKRSYPAAFRPIRGRAVVIAGGRGLNKRTQPQKTAARHINMLDEGLPCIRVVGEGWMLQDHTRILVYTYTTWFVAMAPWHALLFELSIDITIDLNTRSACIGFFGGDEA